MLWYFLGVIDMNLFNLTSNIYKFPKKVLNHNPNKTTKINNITGWIKNNPFNKLKLMLSNILEMKKKFLYIKNSLQKIIIITKYGK